MVEVRDQVFTQPKEADLKVSYYSLTLIITITAGVLPNQLEFISGLHALRLFRELIAIFFPLDPIVSESLYPNLNEK
jgi:hypothetical protein